MTWLYLPSTSSKSAPAWACLEKDCEPGSLTWASRTAPWVTWSGKPIQPLYLQRAAKKEAWTTLLSGAIYSPSTVQRGVEQWIASLRASRAKTSAWRANVLASMASEAASSLTSSTLPTTAVRGSSFWRTSQASLLPPPPLWTKPKGLLKSARPPESWENWPTAGGMRSGSLFPRPTWAPAMGASGGSALLGGWATPRANDAEKRGNVTHRPTMPDLVGQSQNWPTPRGTDGTKGGPNQAGSKGDLMLPSAAAQWPTPCAQDSEQAGGPNANHVTLTRASVAHSSLPALQTQPGPESSPSGPTSPRRLNPVFTEWLMGWPSQWTKAEPSASSAVETESWRLELRQRLSNLLGEHGLQE